MSSNFTGSFNDLKEKLKSISKDWDETQYNKKTLRYQGGVLSWFETTGTLQFQGKSPFREQLENKVLSLLYPDEYQEETSESSNIIEGAEEEVDYQSKQQPLELQYLTEGVTESEIVIGLVSPVGTQKRAVLEPLEDRIKGFGYEVEVIRVSANLPDYKGQGKEYDRIIHLMSCGDEIRKDSGNNAILAAGVVKSIVTKRSEKHTPKKIVYIIDSLKHPDEVHFLRKVYGNGFYLFGIHVDIKKKLSYLTADKSFTQEQAKELISKDEYEKDDYGQRTRDAFHLSDLYVNLGDNGRYVSSAIQRFLELIFSNPFVNPTFDEFAMFMAFNSSVRSGDLSRQVGAVITKNKQIIATGANDCPKYGGGQYWPELDRESGEIKDINGGKDYTLGEDSNKAIQNEIINEILDSAVKDEIISTKKREAFQSVLKRSRISDLTEFGRIVHAEMEALLSCARIGVSTVGATLYCTTFPCHNCAKHIIDAGIKRVVYVEPYPKSKALDLYNDSIELRTNLEKENDDNDIRLIFEPFTGVGARRFLDLFSMTLGSGSKIKRKDKEGNTLSWERENPKIRIPLLPISYKEIETAAVKLRDGVPKK